MPSSTIYRILLLALLPCIAVFIYAKGQKYDPALLDFKAHKGSGPPQTEKTAEQLSSNVSAPIPTELDGFRQFGKSREYTKENLYEQVNGHAEYFISAGFVRLSVLEYVVTGSQSSQSDIQAEVYDMGKNIQAFGVLVDESGENPAPAQVGSMGFKTSNGVNFIKGKYYVKISAFNNKTPVLKFAKSFEKTLNAGADAKAVFSKFPDIGKINSTRFIKEGYRGLDFLRNVVEREYSFNGKTIQVALLAEKENEAQKLMSALLVHFKKSDTKFDKTLRNGKDIYKVIDKYEGDWFLISGQGVLFGIYGNADEEVLKHFTKGKE